MAKDAVDTTAALEREYRTKLIAALQDCAAGQWGLFGTQDHFNVEGLKFSEAARALLVLGEEICAIRARTGGDRFALHDEFVASRGRRSDANEPGEPKRAKAWLERLAGE